MKAAAMLLLHTVAGASAATVSVWAKDQAVTKVSTDYDKSASAYGTFDDTLMKVGWGILDVVGQQQTASSDADMTYAAGFAEGFLTAHRIHDHYTNMYKSHFGAYNASDVAKVEAWMATQYAWSKAQVKAKQQDLFWRQVGNVLTQFDGLGAGYNHAAKQAGSGLPQLPQFAFSVLNGDGDLFQIIPAVLEHARKDWDSMSVDEADTELMKIGKCSSIIKVTGDLSQLFMGHSSWYTYAATNRIFKHYNFNFKDQVAAKKVSFSSYPGYLESLDDFYMMDSGLGMVQTSISFTNPKFWAFIKPQSLLAWQRVRTSHVVAHTGEEWHAAMSTAFSGTYCNQYMVVDFNKFKPGKPLVDGTLWVVEEIPGQIPGADKTELLTYGYWPSYNVPYFPQVYDESGYLNLSLRGVPSASYQEAPRAQIFRRDADTVKSLDTYKNILRYNEYKTDPYSHGDSCNAICCRGDFRSGGGSPFGCIDTKVTDNTLFWNMTAHIINGPTRGGKDDLPAFTWKEFPKDTPVGLPETYEFNWVEVAPKKLP